MPSIILDRHQKRATFILGLLEKKSCRRKDIKTKWLIQGFPESMFNSMFDWLRKRGYIMKELPQKHTSPYLITESGREHLKGLRA